MTQLKKAFRYFLIGLFFLLPIVLIIFIVEKIIHLLTPIGNVISNSLKLHSFFGQTSVLLVCIFLLLSFCILCGYFVQKGVLKKWSSSMEEQLFILFPSLQVLKYRMVKNDKKSVINEFWQAIVFLGDHGGYNISFITESSEKFFTLYIPDAPKIDAGEVRFVKKSELTYFPISMQLAMSSLYSFGKGLAFEDLIGSDEKPS